MVCEQIVFSIPDRLKNLDKAEPRPRFKNEAEREAHKLAISRRKHNELFNENFSPTSLYSTLRGFCGDGTETPRKFTAGPGMW